MREIRHAPEPPFPVEWCSTAMDEIRAAATEGFFALPHGGLEIGGVLWGTRANGGMRIVAARPLECEHALGPTFTLSPNDHARLAAMLANGPEGCEPLGWYRSRTRGEICFSPGDLEIHDRYFPEPGQLALMVRPHAIDPMGLEYFFEVGQAPCLRRPLRPPERVPRYFWKWLRRAVVVLALAVAALVFRGELTRVLAAHPASPSLVVYNLHGQLQIRWDADGENATLEITDGADRTIVELDRRRLRAGSLTYVHKCARVDLRLVMRAPGGAVREASTTFLGPLE